MFLRNKYTARVMALSINGEATWVNPGDVVEVSDDYGKPLAEKVIAKVNPFTGASEPVRIRARPDAGKDTWLYFEKVEGPDVKASANQVSSVLGSAEPPAALPASTGPAAAQKLK